RAAEQRRRRRTQLALAAAVGLVLLGGIVGTSLGFLRAERLRQVAETNEQQALAEKSRAEASQQQALDALRGMTDEEIEKLLGSRPALGPSEKAFLQAALKRWQAFAAEQGDSERARAIRAEGLGQVAHLRQKLGQDEEAQAGWEQARALFEALAADV